MFFMSIVYERTYMGCVFYEEKNGTDEPISKAGIETQMQGTDVWAPRGRGGEGKLSE